MHDISTRTACVPASAVSTFTASPYFRDGVNDMSRSFLFAATFLLLGTTHAAFAADGKALYGTTCVACHGAKAQGTIPGVPHLAKRLNQSDEVLVAHIVNGFQTKGSPMAMPPKGDNPNLTSDDAKAIVVYLRTLTGTSPPPAPAASAAPKRAPASAPAAVARTTPPEGATVTAATRAPAPAPVAAIAMAPASASVAATSQPAIAPSPQPDMAAFAQGAKAWADNCSRCHNMRDPRELRDDQWRVVITHMRMRAGLTGQEARDILTFLQQSNNGAAVVEAP